MSVCLQEIKTGQGFRTRSGQPRARHRTRSEARPHHARTSVPVLFPRGSARLTRALPSSAGRRPLSWSRGIGSKVSDEEGRVTTVEFASLYLVSVYVPNSQRGLPRLGFRLRWDKLFRLYVQELSRRKPVVFCGDMNVAHQEIDIARPEANRMNPGFTDRERRSFGRLLAGQISGSASHGHRLRAERLCRHIPLPAPGRGGSLHVVELCHARPRAERGVAHRLRVRFPVPCAETPRGLHPG